MFKNRDDLIDGADSRWLSELVARIKPTIDTTPSPHHKQKLKEKTLAVFDEALAGDIRKFEQLASLPLPVPPSPQHKRELKEKVLAVFDETAADEIRQARQRRLRRRRLRFAIAGAARSRTFKVAAAAVFLVCAFGVLNWLTGTAAAGTTFAKVLEKVRNTTTVTYTLVVEFAEGPTAKMKIMRASEGGMRVISDDGKIQVSDLKRDKVMALNPTKKTARIMHSRFAKGKFGPSDFIQALMGLTEDSGKFDSRGTIDGRTANIFRIEEPSQWMTVWTDPQTNLPIRIEAISLAQKDTPIPISQAKWVFSDFVWGSQLDKSLFQAVVPEDYVTLSATGPPSETDLAAMLRWLGELPDEDIPSQFNLNTVPKLLASLDKAITAHLTGGLTVGVTSDSVPIRTGANTPQEKQRAVDERLSICRGILFILEELGGRADVGFSKAGLRSGDSRTPICWWKPKGSTRYRAVYGDFTVRDLEGRVPPSVP